MKSLPDDERLLFVRTFERDAQALPVLSKLRHPALALVVRSSKLRGGNYLAITSRDGSCMGAVEKRDAGRGCLESLRCPDRLRATGSLRAVFPIVEAGPCLFTVPPSRPAA
jgi:hypothetical protein